MDSLPAGVAPSQRRFASFGAALLLLTLIAVITGLVLLPFYTPVAGKAHPSVAAMEAIAPLRILRAAHHWASALLVLLGAIYLLHGIFTAAYRRPLHLAWWAAVGLFLLFFLFQLTGHLLPWDQHAVSSAVIEAGIAANAPLLGPLQGRLVRGGGETFSGRTLTAWYVAHVALSPLALAGLVWLFVSQLRRVGLRWSLPRWVVGAVLGILALISVVIPAPLGPPATEADYNTFTSPPEWYVLPLHGLLNLAQSIHPNLAFVGTMVLPGLVLVLLLALPFLDPRHADEPRARGVAGAAAVGAVGVLALTLMNAHRMAPLFSAVEAQANPAMAAAAPSNVRLDPKLVRRGRTIYEQNGCQACHKIGTEGGAAGPALDGTGQRHADLDWQIRHLNDPASQVPGSTMPSFKHLSEDDLRALATYLLSLK